MAAPTAPQPSFFSTQDVINPDVNQYYQIIKNIDTFRSRFNVSTSNLSESISRGDIDGIISGNNMNDITYQESRCNAFYRMIGFPIASSNGDFYNGGFDPDGIRNDDKITKKLNIANAILTSELNSILTARENFPKNSSLVFVPKNELSTNTAIASILLRPLEKQIDTDTNPLEANPQSFKVPDRSIFTAGGDLADVVSENSIHILRPFIIDPRVDFTVTPATNRICVPFLQDKSKTQLASSIYLKRPYLERVIATRFATTNTTIPPNDVAHKFVQGVIDFIKTNIDITDKSLVDAVANPDDTFNSGIENFARFIKIIDALVTQLVNATTEIKRIMDRINWQPIPDIRGPEFGCSLRDVDPADQLNKSKERDIADQRRRKILSETQFDTGIDSIDPGNFALNIDGLVFGGTQNMPKIFDQQLNTLIKQRNALGNQAAAHLRTIEIIMGEFSGLGLLDIMAIQAALWIMTDSALAGFLDADTTARINNTSNLSQNISLPGSVPITDALKEFEKKLSGIYALTQAFINNAVNGGEKLNNIQ